jgi:hypothetical protein
MPCYSSNTSLDADRLDDGAATYYYVSLATQSPIRITFVPPSGESITGVSCSPTGPSVGTDWVEFGTAHIGGTYTVTVTYTGSQLKASPLDTPTKLPKFRPASSCP